MVWEFKPVHLRVFCSSHVQKFVGLRVKSNL